MTDSSARGTGSLNPDAVTVTSAAADLHNGDLETMARDLGQRQETLRKEYAASTDQLRELLAAVGEIEGQGYAEDGAVRATVDAQNRIVDLELSPEALRLGSIERLRNAIVDALDFAYAHAQQQIREAGGMLGDDDPVQAYLDVMPEVATVLPRGFGAAHRRPDETDPTDPDADTEPNEDSGRSWTNDQWQRERNPYE
ncbi:YbaB/EbfC family nucleoid-associated protein [Parenemella sanctibonifatiensis]|uniref:YbaB/EbfC family nucleoid-associated protein n=1 Tax=Parenemella sanctibonifatiensis TaxID=2016505 RepID=UPI001E2D93C2|nr:YbaB/EbfC family nucleoid-associated protein [Parenemella sanctibonifatiensis]